MKKLLFMFVLLVFLSLNCGVVFAQQLQRPVIAVTPFNVISGISPVEAETLMALFFTRMHNSSAFTVLDRNAISRAIEEQTFDWARQLQVEWIVRGELRRFGDNILLTITITQAITQQIIAARDIAIEVIESQQTINHLDGLIRQIVVDIYSQPRPR